MNNKLTTRIIIHINDLTKEVYSALINSNPSYKSMYCSWNKYIKEVRPSVTTNFIEITMYDDFIKVLDNLNISYDIINLQTREKALADTYGDSTHLI